MREHTILFTDVYVDIYKPFTPEALNLIARNYLTTQFEKPDKDLKRFNQNPRKNSLTHELTYEPSLKPKEIQYFGSLMVDFHTAALDYYTFLCTTRKSTEDYRKTFMPKPFSVSMLKQLSSFFSIYMKRIRENELLETKKLNSTFQKLNEVEKKLENLDTEMGDLDRQLEDLERLLKSWEDKIEMEKQTYKAAVEACRLEEKHVEETNVKLEKLRLDVNVDNQTQANQVNPQYETALKAIKSLDRSNFNELKSFRAPPQRVLAVVNTLCLMFRQPPGWESGKQLLIRDNFFDELVYYDKKNIADDIYNALSQICSVETFRPEHVAPGSMAAASFCSWILAIYEFSKFERTYGAKLKELKKFEDTYNKRLVLLGEKRINAEKVCLQLESHANSRLNVLKSIKATLSDKDKLKQSEAKAKQLLQLLQTDHVGWKEQANQSQVRLQTFKVDALLTAAFICYASVFDLELREKLTRKWFQTVESKPLNLAESRITFMNQTTPRVDAGQKHSKRPGFSFKQLLTNPYEYESLMLQLNKLSFRDEHFIESCLILRELCSLPTQMNWPLVYDPENQLTKVMSVLQESIDSLKTSLNTEVNVFNMGEMTESAEVMSEGGSSVISSSEMVRYTNVSRKSITTDISEHSSVWEASTFYSRKHSSTLVYQKKAASALLEPSLAAHIQTNLVMPVIESDLNVLPKDNLCVLDAADEELNYKLINAAVHGLCVLLRNAERFAAPNRLVEILYERDFLYEKATNRDFIKVSEEEIYISPLFKLVLHVNTPISLNFKNKANSLFQRFNSQANAAHACVDFALSSALVRNELLNVFMEYEKPGYTNQQLLFDRILLQSEASIFYRQVRIIL